MSVNQNYNSVDFLRPIRESNRDEYILVEFHRVLKNTNMSLMVNIMRAAIKDPQLIEVLPKLEVYSKMDLDDLYTSTVQFNSTTDLIFNLSGEMFDADLCNGYAENFQEPYRFDELHRTRMEGILRHLLTAKFVKQLIIFAPSFNEEMKRYIAMEYGDVGIGTRVIPVEGFLIDCLQTYPQITTAFISDMGDLEIADRFYPSLLQNRMFVVSDGYGNLEPSPKGDSVVYKGEKMMKRLRDEKVCQIFYAYPYCIPKMPHIDS